MRKLLPFIFVIIFIHFLKDITQDILKIATPLDLLGNVNEDLSKFPEFIRLAFSGIGYASFLMEIYLIVSIPLTLVSKKYQKLEKSIWVILGILVLYFTSAVLLDPRF